MTTTQSPAAKVECSNGDIRWFAQGPRATVVLEFTKRTRSYTVYALDGHEYITGSRRDAADEASGRRAANDLYKNENRA